MTLFFFSTKNKYINKEIKKRKENENENVHIGPVKDNHYKYSFIYLLYF